MIYSIIEACESVLEDYGGAMSPYWIASNVMEARLWRASEADVRDALNKDIEKWGEKSQFVKVGDDEFALGKWPEKQRQATPSDSPTMAAVEADLFGVLLAFHKKIITLLRTSSLDDAATTITGERINLLLDNITAEVAGRKSIDLQDRLDAALAEATRIVAELANPPME